ncbi:MAG: CaiB/BaiF CoA transferase family protein, partial [Novosphingobium sp.]
MTSDGPLKGLRVVEFSGIGPAPFAGMLLADMGADVVRIDRPNAPMEYVLARGKRSIALNMKQAADRDMAIDLIERAEILIEGFRPGVMERLGLGPEPMLAINPKLVYGRMTGWGQFGPLAQAAGHDLNYIAISGALHAIGSAEGPPLPPLNLVGDFGGGSLFLAMGLLAALSHARATGQGQVVDAAMSDGASSLMGLFYGLKARGEWNDARSTNFLDGAAPYYRCYRCADGAWVSIAAIEPQFWAELRERLELIDPLFDRRDDAASWPEI